MAVLVLAGPMSRLLQSVPCSSSVALASSERALRVVSSGAFELPEVLPGVRGQKC